MAITEDYLERVYAGVLGKIIGVYLGRPFEGGGYDVLTGRFGQIDRYVHEDFGVQLIVTDDDISGTFTFVRALDDYDAGRKLQPQQIGQTWLNYIMERRTILWWGGMGVSTEHTAFLRLKCGVKAPVSGSSSLNSQIVAEQIGAQIFIDGWAMVAPGDPELAAELARRAGSVSHDGAAVHAAQVIAAMESLAFVEQDFDILLDAAIALIPADGIIRRLIDDVRSWHAADSQDWRAAFLKVREKYGYDKFGGGCHVVPNHAVIILALLYSGGDFSRSLMIANTCGWDTDCNSGNVGCLMGIRNGLAGIDASAYDWRGPVADRLYLPTADGGRAISDAGSEALRIANIGLRLAGKEPLAPKDGARFHFDLPGLVHGYQVMSGAASIENVAGNTASGSRVLAIRCAAGSSESVRIATPTFTPPDLAIKARGGYDMVCSPTLYSGQTITAGLTADAVNTGPIEAALYIEHYDADDKLATIDAPSVSLIPGQNLDLEWTTPDTGGQPIARVGIRIAPTNGFERADAYIDYVTWSGAPELTLSKLDKGKVWPMAWVDAVDAFEHHPGSVDMRIVRNSGTGLLIQGEREWTDYSVTADLKCHFAECFGLAGRVQGLKRYYALVLQSDGRAELIKELDGTSVLADCAFPWEFDRRYELSLAFDDDRIRAFVDGSLLFDIEDTARPLTGGALAVMVDTGNVDIGRVSVTSTQGA